MASLKIPDKIANYLPGVELSLVLAFGALMLVAGAFAENIHGILVGFFSLSPDSGIAKFVAEELEKAKGIGGWLLFSGIVIYMTASGLWSFYQRRIDPIVVAHKDHIVQELQETREQASDMYGARVLEAVIHASSKDSARSQLRNIHVKAYGKHCASENSLISAVEEQIGPYLEDRAAHRADYHQTITVRECADGQIEWHEQISYDLRILGLEVGATQAGDRPPPVKHELRARSISEIRDLVLGGEHSKFSYTLKVDGEKIFEVPEDIELIDGNYRPKKGIDGLVLEIRPEDIFALKFDRVIGLTKKRTRIEIEEKSIVADDYFVARRKDPTFGSMLNIHLPDGWIITSHIYSGEDWRALTPRPNTLTASKRGWVLPGIVFVVKWAKHD